MAAAQWEDPELLKVQSSSSSLTLEPIPLQMSDTSILCDTSTGAPRPFHLSFAIQCLIPFTLSLILEYKPNHRIAK